MRLAVVILVGGLMVGFSTWFAPLKTAGVAFTSVGLVLAASEWIRLSRGIRLKADRLCDEKLSLGAENLVRLRIRNSSYARLSGLVRDEHPEGMDAPRNVMPLQMTPRSEMTLSYHVTPPTRGDFEFGDTYIRLTGPLGLLMRQIRLPMKQQVKVYPNLLDMRRYEIGLRRARAVQPGQRLVRLLGRGTDFESLREYSPDDEFRAVDWKASARRGKLTTRQYQDEKAQNVMIVLDSGRVMGAVIAGLTRLDHGINAAMMVAHVAAIKGDKVGLMAFGEDIIAYSPPRAGRSQVLNLLRLTYNLREAAGDSNYYRAIPYLTRKWTRRSLVVFFTDMMDPESSKPLISQITSLTKKHLCMCVVMSDPAVLQASSGEVTTPEEVFTAAAARQALQARKRAIAQLTRAGAIVLDVPPESFTPAVVNEYLNIKARGRL